MTLSLVSVVVAAHNAEPWIAATIESVIAQTYSAIELIVVDDGSTDETLSIARRYETNGANSVRVFTQPNRGACSARNLGTSKATGDFIQYLDADDLIAPRKIALQMDRLLEEPAGTVATGPWARFYGDISGVDHSSTGPDFRDFEVASDWLLESWLGRGTIPLHAWLVPQGLIADAGEWNEHLKRNQDGEFFTRILVRARKIAFVEGAWSYYRSGLPGSISGQKSEEVLRSLYRSKALCERSLLADRDTPETRAACAGLWELFLFSAYPQVPDLCAAAEARIEELGGPPPKPNGSRAFEFVRDTLGWKAAVRLQRGYGRLRYG